MQLLHLMHFRLVWSVHLPNIACSDVFKHMLGQLLLLMNCSHTFVLFETGINKVGCSHSSKWTLVVGELQENSTIILIFGNPDHIFVVYRN